MHPAQLLLPLLLSTLTADGLSEETELPCKQTAISAGRVVERDLLVNLIESRLRGKFTNVCEAGLQCKRHCQVASVQSDFFEFREVYRLTLVVKPIQEGFFTFRCDCFKLKRTPNISLLGKWYSGLMSVVTDGKTLYIPFQFLTFFKESFFWTCSFLTNLNIHFFWVMVFAESNALTPCC